MIPNEHGAWVTVKEASILAKRSIRRIYDWIEDGRVRVTKGTDGVKRVWGADVLKAESEARNGRPPK